MTRTTALGVIAGLTAVAVAALLPPLPQDPAYHRLADGRSWLGVPNAANVLSNVGFVLVGALGLALLARSAPVGLLDAVVAERIGVRIALRLLGPLVALAALSVGYWAWTEQHGAGDLRAYVLVQFFPLVAIPLTLWWRTSRYTGGAGLLAAAAIYGLPKVPELSDAWIFSVTRLVSGHTLKHLLAALAGYGVPAMLDHRRAAEARTP